jgi:hypothetical protein
MNGKIILIVCGIVIIGVVVFALVSRQTAVSAKATGAGAIDPVTGQAWQTTTEAAHQADAIGSTQATGSLVGA